MLKKDLEPFRGLTTDVKFTINSAKSIIGVLTENVRVKIYHQNMFGPLSGMFELRLISNQKWANAWLALRYIGLGYFFIILTWTYFGKTSSIIQSSRQKPKFLVYGT